jgi:hypothetical protein
MIYAMRMANPDRPKGQLGLAACRASPYITNDKHPLKRLTRKGPNEADLPVSALPPVFPVSVSGPIPVGIPIPVRSVAPQQQKNRTKTHHAIGYQKDGNLENHKNDRRVPRSGRPYQ